ncbi:hypothetical protein DQ04_05501030 [Trypanosoma grayi]|uniref:hypothetical protein n=1 Tax=Trypanosoma grayi TaxID=71804 RepID=UPI0004F4313B|nr:hypothetical protein DQ04_05501030 [Trypanosoma grayi]KEG09273.1 hypothetical protein DQ04_05501030 [Trypanosoma grayi]
MNQQKTPKKKSSNGTHVEAGVQDIANAAAADGANVLPPRRLSLRARCADEHTPHEKQPTTPRRLSETGEPVQQQQQQDHTGEFSDANSEEPQAEMAAPVPVPQWQQENTAVMSYRKVFEGDGWPALLSSARDNIERTLLNETSKATGLHDSCIRIVDMDTEGEKLVAELALVYEATKSEASMRDTLDNYPFDGMKMLLEIKAEAREQQPTGLGALLQNMAMQREEEDGESASSASGAGEKGEEEAADGVDAPPKKTEDTTATALQGEKATGPKVTKKPSAKAPVEKSSRRTITPRSAATTPRGTHKPQAAPSTPRRAATPRGTHKPQAAPSTPRRAATPRGTHTHQAAPSTPRRTATPRGTHKRQAPATPRRGGKDRRADLSRGPDERRAISTPCEAVTPRGLSTPRSPGKHHHAAEAMTPLGSLERTPRTPRLPRTPRHTGTPRSPHQGVRGIATLQLPARGVTPDRAHSATPTRSNGRYFHPQPFAVDAGAAISPRKHKTGVRRGEKRPIPPQRVERVGGPCCRQTPRVGVSEESAHPASIVPPDPVTSDVVDVSAPAAATAPLSVGSEPHTYENEHHIDDDSHHAFGHENHTEGSEHHASYADAPVTTTKVVTEEEGENTLISMEKLRPAAVEKTPGISRVSRSRSRSPPKQGAA